MAYTINKTNGEALPLLADNTTASFAGLTLLGKRVTSYGEYFNENFVRLVENFKFNDPPINSTIGQLWYKENEGIIKVKISDDPDNDKAWKPVGTPRVSATAHASPTIGDLWYDTTVTSQQLKMYNGASWISIGPYVAVPAGVSGVEPDTNSGNIILKVSIASTIVAIISNTEFTPSPAIVGFSKIYPGINFRTSSEAGQINTASLTLNNNGIFPTENNTKDIGSETLKFNDVYATNFQGNATSANSAVNASNATNIGIAIDSSNATFYPAFVAATTGNVAGKVNTNLTVNLGNTPAETTTLSVPKITLKQLTSTVETGVAPFIVASETKVDNLYAAKADKWAASRTVTFATGDVTGSFSIDGSANVNNVELSISNSATVETKAAGTNDSSIASTSFVNTAVNNLMPAGTIVMWFGRKSEIPAGWKLCDGTNNTPDLRNRFIIGAVDDSNNRPATNVINQFYSATVVTPSGLSTTLVISSLTTPSAGWVLNYNNGTQNLVRTITNAVRNGGPNTYTFTLTLNSAINIPNESPVVLASGSSLTEIGGQTNTPLPNHTHVITDNGHTHAPVRSSAPWDGGVEAVALPANFSWPDVQSPDGNVDGSRVVTGYDRSTIPLVLATSTTGIGISSTGQADVSFSNLPPYRALYYIMKG